MWRNLIAILFLSVVPGSASLITVTSVDWTHSVPSSGAPAQAFLGTLQPVPEGGSMGLMALGGLALVAVGSYRRG